MSFTEKVILNQVFLIIGLFGILIGLIVTDAIHALSLIFFPYIFLIALLNAILIGVFRGFNKGKDVLSNFMWPGIILGFIGILSFAIVAFFEGVPPLGLAVLLISSSVLLVLVNLGTFNLINTN